MKIHTNITLEELFRIINKGNYWKWSGEGNIKYLRKSMSDVTTKNYVNVKDNCYYLTGFGIKWLEKNKL